jgi:hypothetical protein
MARERISLVPEEVKTESTIRAQILNGEITPEVFATLSAEEQSLVNKVLFQIASEKVNPNVGASVLEFVLFSFMRIATKKMNGLSLTAEDQEIEASLNRIMGLHEITDSQTPKGNWMFDYLSYAEEKAAEILRNRMEHVTRKIHTIGQV